jgi:O-methyltransferase
VTGHSTNGDIALSPGNMTPYDLQPEIEQAVERVRYHTMVSFSRLATNYQMAAYCQSAEIPGTFVECGVWKGGSSGLMAIASLHHGKVPRDLHLFDSFDDLCQPDESVDGERAVQQARDWAGQVGPLTGALAPMHGFYDQLGGPGSVADCEDLIINQIGYPSEHVHIHQGWFQDTLAPARAELGDIAILRLDCDYYHSTKYCLETLFDQVTPGGFVIIDDYGWYEGCRAAVDEVLATRPRPYFLNHADADGRYLIKH